MLAAPAGSTPTRWIEGAWAFSHRARPASSPPPPTGTSTVSIGPPACSSSSGAMVPCPTMVRASSKGWTYTAPVRSASAWAAALASS